MIESMSNAGGTLTIRVVRAECCGYGVCRDTCPELYKVDDDGLVELTMATIPAELEEGAILGAESCPQLAIKIEQK
jgi:ferredoxin